MGRINFCKYGGAVVWTAGLAMLLAVLSLRYGVIENDLLPRNCDAGAVSDPAWQCALKWGLVQTFHDQRLGWFSLACGLGAFALSCRRLAWAGWLSGIAGLVLYSYDYAAVGALSALLVLLRSQGGQGECQTRQ